MGWQDEKDYEGRGERAWYVIHTYSGYENKVKANLESKVASQGLGDEIFNVIVPMEDEIETKDNGKQKVTKRKVFPGYVLVDMIVNNRSWYVVRNTQGVTGFVGSEKDPIPLTPDEVERIMATTEVDVKASIKDFAVGDRVHIKSGWFRDYSAVVVSIDEAEGRLKLDVDGKSVELDAEDVEKV
jgi:transcriptional antiterminator NusG